MGDVKDTVKGTPPKKRLKSRKKLGKGNLVDQLQELQDEISDLISTKDHDTLTEGDDLRPENTRKAATLRSMHTLIVGAKNLAEDY